MTVRFYSNVNRNTLEPYFIETTRYAARCVARRLKNNVRDQVPQHLGDAVGEWKGWETSGKDDGLWHSIVVGEDKRWGKTRWKAKVRIKRGSEAQKYALIHEVGGIIYANNRFGMKFWGLDRATGADLGIIRKHKVFIRPKGYFSQGLDQTRREMSELAELIKRRRCNEL